MLKEDVQQELDQKEKEAREVSIRLEKMQQDYHRMLKDLGLESDQLKEFIETPENFSKPIWERLQEEKKQLDEKLNLSLAAIKDPSKTKKTFSERATIQPHWIFVR